MLEFVRRAFGLPREKVGAFGSWETFNWIAEHEEGALTINAGYEAFETTDPVARTLSDAQFTAKTPWDSARHDAFTFGLALHYLKTSRPARSTSPSTRPTTGRMRSATTASSIRSPAPMRS